MSTRSRSLSVFTFLLLSWSVLPSYISAQVRKRGDDPLSRLEFTNPKLALTQPLVPYAQVAAQLRPATSETWQSFQGRERTWVASVDRRTAEIAFASGGGIAWIKKDAHADMKTLEKTAREFLGRSAPFLGVDPESLVLNPGRSTQPAPQLWIVDFDVLAEGTPIEGTRVVFRVNNGNLVQFGSEYLPSPGAKAPAPRLDRDKALAVVDKFIGGFKESDTIRDRGSLHLIPIDLTTREPKEFRFGEGRGLARVWQFLFERPGIIGTFRARVDAATGELLEFRDTRRYAQATGGIYANSPATGAEATRPFPYVDLSTGGFSGPSGLYTFSGGALSSTLNGKYVKIVDTCGPISLPADGSGNLSFGTSAGTDCTTPGVGGTGNTHSARQQYYQTNRAMEIARDWLPSNTWLNQQLTVNVDLTGTCNAFWNSSNGTLNFYQAHGTCKNTGENAGVTLHEFGHGLDQNDGDGFSPDGGTGESIGDITSFMLLHNSCIGPGVLPSNCGGYGVPCTGCTGFRDVDWGKRDSTTPHTVSNFSQVHCNIPDYPGMCGVSAHCESYIASEAVWDLINRDLPSPGTDSAWNVGERLFFSSRPTGTAAFVCNTSGATWTSNGCNAGSLWEVFRFFDDDDGNLANGTPHGGALYAAFNRHGIACPTDPGADTTFSGCTPPPTPTLTVTGGTNQVTASWTASAGAVYDVYRNEVGCNAAFDRVASGLSTTTYVDTSVANGTSYFYEVVAYPSGNLACSSPPTVCLSANLSGADPGIRPWGAALDPQTPPYWQSQDIWVDNNGNGVPNEAGEPTRGLTSNQLFGRVTNSGNAGATGYRVSFAAKPYTTSAEAPAAAVGSVDESGTLAPGASQAYNVTWDLSDTWVHANFDPMFWTADHFCVVVGIGDSGAGTFNDVNLANNNAQSNFDNIPLAGGARSAQARFYIYNHLDKEAVASLDWTSHTPGWTLRFRGIESPKRVALKPKEWKEVVAVVTGNAEAAMPCEHAPILIDLTQKLDGRTVGGLTLAVQPHCERHRPTPKGTKKQK